ncbi:MAG TPA: hypothetical protein VNZ52_00575 [Candidatus Thermoplasmatota archaeon]|nr:hypothetical protein [Candidatus Thermoplasmatota archaeon]
MPSRAPLLAALWFTAAVVTVSAATYAWAVSRDACAAPDAAVDCFDVPRVASGTVLLFAGVPLLAGAAAVWRRQRQLALIAGGLAALGLVPILFIRLVVTGEASEAFHLYAREGAVPLAAALLDLATLGLVLLVVGLARAGRRPRAE